MIRLAALLTLTLAITGTAAAATRALPGDPRVCQFHRPAYCALTNAQLAARKFVGGPGKLFQGPSHCSRVSTFTFSFSCVLGDNKYLVKYAKGPARWRVTVTS